MQHATPKKEQALCDAIAHAADQVRNSAFFIGIQNSLDRRAYDEALDELQLAGAHSKVSAAYRQELRKIAQMLEEQPGKRRKH